MEFAINTTTATLDDYFCVRKIELGKSISFLDAEIEMVEMLHVKASNGEMKSYGLFITVPSGLTSETDYTRVFITTDSMFQPLKVMKRYEAATIIFQDCETYDITGASKSGVHAHYTDLKTLPEEIKAKMWLYHYSDGDLPDATKDGFAGFVRRGQVFNL